MLIKELKTDCPRCGGLGRMAGINRLGITQINPDGRCPDCQGRGYLLSPLGGDMVNLISPFMLPDLVRRVEELAARLPILEEKLTNLEKKLGRQDR
ncbi:MAG: hypothetical protein OEW12_08195 [Deltaproteobacteria bacterium]|nr:hypothetical protein [Deltaproteobacteria bacterium]